MPQAGRTFRVFVSSTFSDLKAERNALQEQVFPRLRDLAQAHGCRFQAIDLRWGVSEEAALDQQTMKVCLDEIDRCQHVSPRPNFIVLLGDRYGWRPLPYAIPAGEFQQLLPLTAPDEQERLLWRDDQPAGGKGWYRRDDNAVPSEYVLQPRQKETRFEAYETWESEVERPLVGALERAALQAGLSGDPMVKYTYSATGQEIVRGALKVADAPEHVFGFYRSIANRDEAAISPGGSGFVEAVPELWQRQQELKSNLKTHLRGHVEEYYALWQGEGPSTAHIGSLPATLAECLQLDIPGWEPQTLCEAVWLRLSRVVLAEARGIENIDLLQREINAHHDFGRDRTRHFVGREDALAQIASYLAESDGHLLALWGESGSGQSALIARAAQAAAAQFGKQAIIATRFIGATPESFDGRTVLESLCRQITRSYGGNDETIPSEYRDLVQEFPRRMTLATVERPLIIFLDALDQLADTDEARSLIWLPAELPAYVRLICSTLEGECLAALKEKQVELFSVAPMSGSEGAAMLALLLGEVGRTLTAWQAADLIGKFERGGGLPLYLSLAFGEARLWHSFDGLPGGRGPRPGLADDISGVIEDVISRLGQESYHGHVLVSRVLGNLAAARYGLGEDELLDVLWQDELVKGDFFKRVPQSPHDISALPAVIWARLYQDLAPYLAHRTADGVEVVAFYHGRAPRAAHKDDLDHDHHAELAAYFAAQPLYRDTDKRSPNLRKLTEMVYQLAGAGRANDVEDALLDYKYLRAQLAGHGVEQLISDFNLIKGLQLPSTRVDTLHWVQEGLRLSAHVLQRDPAQLPSQLIGRLLLMTDPSILGLLDQARPETETPWLRPLSASLDGPGGSLVFTLAGHGDRVKSVAATVDGKWAVSGSDDETLKVWDLSKGICVRTMTDRTGSVFAVALAQDGRLVVSGSAKMPFNMTFVLWDVRTGARLHTYREQYRWVDALAVMADGRWVLVSGPERHALSLWNPSTGYRPLTLRGHTDRVTAAAFLPKGEKAVSVSLDGTLRLWELDGGRCLRALKWDRGGLTSVAVSEDGTRVLTGSTDHNILVWNLPRGARTHVLSGHAGSVGGVAMTPDGRKAASGSSDRSVKVWNLESGACICTLTGHTSEVRSVALSKDGQWAVSGSFDNTLKVWDLRRPTLASPAGHGDSVTALAITADGRLAVSGSLDTTLKVWDVAVGSCLRTLTGHKARIDALALTSDGRKAVSGAIDGSLKVWDLVSGACLLNLNAFSAGSAQVARHMAEIERRSEEAAKFQEMLRTAGWPAADFPTRNISAVAVTPDGRRALSCAWDRTLNVWDLSSGACLHTLVGHAARITALALTADGRGAVSGAWDGGLKTWDLQTGSPLASMFGHTDRVTALALTSDGRQAVSGSADMTVKVWDLASGTCLRTLSAHAGQITALALTLDGRQVVSGAIDGALRVWNLADGACLLSMNENPVRDAGTSASMRAGEGSNESALKFAILMAGAGLPALEWPSRQVTGVVVTADGRRAVSGGGDRAIVAWNLANGTRLAAFQAEAAVTHVTLASDGTTIVAGDQGGRLYFLRFENAESEFSATRRPPG